MKRNVAYVSFLLLVGLLGLTGTAFAQSTVFGVSSSINQVRHEGLAEATGQVVLTSSSAGVIKDGSIITLTYQTNLAVVVADANVSCSAGWCSGANITVAGKAGQPIVSISFTADTPVPVGGTATISGIRVNASTLTSGTISTTVAAVVPAAFAGTNAITFSSNTTVPVANVNPQALAVSLTKGPSSILTCTQSVTPSSFEVAMVENFAAAITDLSDELGLSGAGSAQNGSNILVTFTGVPNGVTLNYTGQNTTASKPPAPLTIVVALDASTAASQTASTANATLSFLFDVTGDNTTAIEALLLDWSVSVPSNIGTGITPNAVTATVSLAPVAVSSGTQPVPFFTGMSEGAETVISISDCITNLLFPWVAVDAPGGTYDTGLAIANTTTDPFGQANGGAMPQTGSCTINGYPFAGGTAIVSAVGPIASGQTGAYVLSSISAFAGFRGYLITICQFQNAHAFAFITQNNMTDTGTSQGYLGLVIPTPALTPRNPAGGGYGESLGN